MAADGAGAPRTSKRLEALRRATAGGGDSFAWYALAMELRSLGRTGEAIDAFATLRARDPGYVPMYLMAGGLLAEVGRKAEAREWLDDGLRRARAKGDAHTASELETALAAVDQ